jgi:iron complex outermembrane receptor protein
MRRLSNTLRAVAAVTLTSAGALWAAGELTTAMGVVSVTRDNAGVLTITLRGQRDTIYELVPGEQCKGLEKLDQKVVEVIGTVALDGNVRKLTVRRYREMEPLFILSKAESEEKRWIESRALESHKIVDLAEILSDELVEAQMVRKGGYGNEVSVRGFGQANMRVLLDGDMVEGACGSRKDPSLSHVNMLTVQSVVIEEGPFDVSKPGCLGGYVDIITKKPKPGFDGEVLGKTGSYRFRDGGFTTTGGTDVVQGLVGYNFSEAGQYRDGAGDALWEAREGLAAPYNARGRDAKSFQKHDVWGKLRLTPGRRHTVLLEHSYGRASDIVTPRVVFDIDKEITNLSKVSWDIRDLGGASDNLAFSAYRNAVGHYPYQGLREVADPKNNDVESVITGGRVRNVTGTHVANFTYGVDVYRREWWGDVYDSRTGAKINGYLIPSVGTLDGGGYVEMDRDMRAWSLKLGLRYDRFEQEADEDLVFTKSVTDVNRRLNHLVGGYGSLKYYFNDDITVFGGAGRSYRTPESTERYIQGSPTFFGNPLLDPTANTESDWAFKFERGGGRFQAKGFYSDLANYIYQENNAAGYQIYTNIDAHIYGGDVAAGVDLVYGLSCDGGIAYQRGFKDSYPDNNADEDLGQMAPLKTRLALCYDDRKPFGQEDAGLSATLEWVHSAAAEHIDVDAGEKPLPAWDIMNTRMGYRFKWFRLNAGVDNVFDREYTVANSYEWDVIGGSGANPAIVNEPGRFFYGGLELKW